MRDSVIGLLVAVLAFLGPAIWDRLMSEAPELWWRVVFFVAVGVGLAWFALSDPIYSRISDPLRYRYTSTALVSLLCAGMVGSAWWFFVAAPKIPLWSVVTVYPSEFPLHSGKWSNTVQLTVTNTGRVPLYSVWVDIEPDSKEALDGMTFDTDRDANSIKQKIGGIEIDTDVFALTYTDSLGIRFYQLLPNQPRRVTVSGGAAVKSKAVAKIVGAQASPERLIKQTTPPKP